MNLIEIGKLTDEELCIKAAELAGWKHSDKPGYIYPWGKAFGIKTGPCSWKDPHGKWGTPPNYLDNITATWELWQHALSSDRFWDFCQNLKMLASSNDFTVVMGYLSPGLITRAFILAMEEDTK